MTIPMTNDCVVNWLECKPSNIVPVGTINMVRTEVRRIKDESLKAYGIDVKHGYIWHVMIMAIDGDWYDVCLALNMSSAYQSGLQARYRMTGQFQDG